MLCRSDSVGSSNGSVGACTDEVSNHANSFGRDCVAWVQSRLCCCLKRSDPDTNTAIESRGLCQLDDAKPHFSPAARAAPDDIEEKPGGLKLLKGFWGEGKVYRDDEDALRKCFGLKKEKELGEGNFGTVYKYLDSENTAYAVKIHKQAEGETTLVYHEGEDGNCYDDFKENRGELIGLVLPSHPNVAKVHACIMQDINSGKYIPYP